MQPPVQRIRGALLPEVQWQVRVTDRTPAPSAEVKYVWSYTSTQPYVSWRGAH